MKNKIELHVHLDGCLREKTVINIAKKEGITLPINGDIKKHLRINGTVTNLSEYLTKFDIPLKIMQKIDAIYRIAYEFVEDSYKAGYKYCEVRFSPHIMTRGGEKVEDIVAAALEGLNKATQKFGIKVNLILCIMRHHPVSEGFEVVELAQNFVDVIGIDIAGDEYNFPLTPFKQVFAKAKKLDIPFTIHAGEARGAESVWTAVNLGAQRIGHGVRANEDKKLLDIIKKRKIVLEFCPISNYQTSVLNDFSEYPIKQFLNMGIKVCLNTDNRTVSNTSIEKEVEFLQNYFDISESDILQMKKNAIDGAFISKIEKDRLFSELK